MDIDVRGTKKRFLAINRERLRRVQHGLRWRQRNFLELLPIFFHLNHAMLPGYVSKQTPAGVSIYTPGKKCLTAVKSFARSFVYKKRIQRQHDIYSIFIMGSVGTIAQSPQSDFDIWLCHNPALNKHQLQELRTKCDKIERWAADIAMEVHFFLINPQEFRQGEMAELSSESSGSSQHHLLLEEFYRSSVLVAGRYPVWWLVPPQEEINYEEYAYQLTHKRFVAEKEVIDLGGLGRVPVEEFFGAALWQVYKGIDSPYKSVLKILLMEVYANEYPHTELLSMQYKRLIYEGVIELNSLDPYAMLLTRLETYLQDSKDVSRLPLVRRCFYFKVQQPLSTVKRRDDDWQRELLWHMIERWGWDRVELKGLDERSTWKVQRVLQEKKLLVDELTKSYLFLSEFARRCNDLPRISQRDVNILGRKLYAAFERKAGKIELVNRGISTSINERKIIIRKAVQAETLEEIWSLLADKNDQQDDAVVLKTGRSAAELIIWCHFNRIVSPVTVITLQTSQDILSVNEVRLILDALEHDFPGGTVFEPQLDDYGKPPAITAANLFVNVGLDPLPNHSRRGIDIVSDRTDVLNYSGFSFNLALSFDMLIVTTWHEILTFRYSGIEGLLNCICQYLWWHKNSAVRTDGVSLSAFSYSSNHSIAIAQRLEKLFDDITLGFYIKGKLRRLRYILEVQQVYYVISTDMDNFHYEYAATLAELYAILVRPQLSFSPIMADRHALTRSALPGILRRNKPGKIQLFYECHKQSADIYILDDYGSLFYQTQPLYDENALLNQFKLFFSSLLSRRGYLLERDSVMVSGDCVEYYRVVKQTGRSVGFEHNRVESNGAGDAYFHVQVIGNVVNQKTVFTIYCEDKEFSSNECGATLFRQVAQHVLDRRYSGDKYPIYITDLDLAPGLLDDRSSNAVQVIEFLQSKRRIEEKLNSELTNL